MVLNLKKKELSESSSFSRQVHPLHSSVVVRNVFEGARHQVRRHGHARRSES
jgi:hypothetical protein